MSPIFRNATAGDVKTVVELVESAYRGESSRVGWTTEAELLGGQRTDRQEVEGLVNDPAAVLRLAFTAPGGAGHVSAPGEARVHRDTDGSGHATASGASDTSELLGCVLVRTDGPLAHVGMFAVRPTLQSRGLGGALLAEAERIAVERGARRARMTVIEQRSELLAWYARRGYRSTCQTEPFPYGNPRFGLPKRDDLRFLVLEKELLAPRRGP